MTATHPLRRHGLAVPPGNLREGEGANTTNISAVGPAWGRPIPTRASVQKYASDTRGHSTPRASAHFPRGLLWTNPGLSGERGSFAAPTPYLMNRPAA